jgi:hypothetical protein
MWRGVFSPSGKGRGGQTLRPLLQERTHFPSGGCFLSRGPYNGGKVPPYVAGRIRWGGLFSPTVFSVTIRGPFPFVVGPFFQNLIARGE